MMHASLDLPASHDQTNSTLSVNGCARWLCNQQHCFVVKGITQIAGGSREHSPGSSGDQSISLRHSHRDQSVVPESQTTTGADSLRTQQAHQRKPKRQAEHVTESVASAQHKSDAAHINARGGNTFAAALSATSVDTSSTATAAAGARVQRCPALQPQQQQRADAPATKPEAMHAQLDHATDTPADRARAVGSQHAGSKGPKPPAEHPVTRGAAVPADKQPMHANEQAPGATASASKPGNVAVGAQDSPKPADESAPLGGKTECRAASKDAKSTGFASRSPSPTGRSWLEAQSAARDVSAGVKLNAPVPAWLSCQDADVGSEAPLAKRTSLSLAPEQRLTRDVTEPAPPTPQLAQPDRTAASTASASPTPARIAASRPPQSLDAAWSAVFADSSTAQAAEKAAVDCFGGALNSRKTSLDPLMQHGAQAQPDEEPEGRSKDGSGACCCVHDGWPESASILAVPL